MVMISGASSPLYAKRRRRNVITMGLSFGATVFGLSWLVLILGVLLWEGFSGLSLAVFTEMTPPPGSAGGRSANRSSFNTARTCWRSSGAKARGTRRTTGTRSGGFRQR